MKKVLLGLAVLCTVNLFAQSIPNGGFESWNNGMYMDPQYYTSSNDQSNGNGIMNFMANCTRVSPAFHGSYALQVSTIKNGMDTMVGYAADGQPNGPNIYGGIPYAQKPTGIRFYYKYATVNTDSALVIAWFKKSGSVVGTYMTKIHTLSGVFTLFSAPLIPALAVTPDTLVFAVASSVAALNQGKAGPVGSVFTIDSVTFTGGVSQPAELNGDFENWNPMDTLFIPTKWYAQAPVRWSTDAHAGNYSAQMSTGATPNGVAAGMVSTGTILCPNNCMSNCKCMPIGEPYTQTNDSLTFWYKYNPAGGPDTAWATLQFIKDTIYSTMGMQMYGTAGAWRYATEPINLATAPDSVIVAFGSSISYNNGPLPSHIGTVLKIDNVQFKSQPLAVSNLHHQSNGIAVYPNPNHGVFQVQIATSVEGANNIEVYNMLGEKVLSQPNVQGTVINVNLGGQSSGVYLLRVISSAGDILGILKIVKF